LDAQLAHGVAGLVVLFGLMHVAVSQQRSIEKSQLYPCE
jgi:hypothetical protein